MPWELLFIERQMEGASKSDFLTGAWKYALILASFTPDPDTNDFFNDISASELAASGGYTAGGYTLANKTSSVDTATDEWRFDNTVDPNWTTFTPSGAFRWGYFYEDTAGASSTDPLAGHHDLGSQNFTNVTFTVQLDATGIAKIDTT
jgi:hypothetical protein